MSTFEFTDKRSTDIMGIETGVMIIQSAFVHGAYNTLIIPSDAPNEWFYQQFPTTEALENFAQQYGLTMRKEENDN